MNGALYTSWVSPSNINDASAAARFYCDANDGTGNNLWCPEMDLAESNRCSFKTTSHPVTDLNTNLKCAEPWVNDAVNCFFPPAAYVGKYYDDATGTWVSDADRTNLLYCGFGVPNAITERVQSWVDRWGNAQDFTSAAAAGSGWQRCTEGATMSCSYGPSLSIDTSRPYDVKVSFAWDDDHLVNFTTTLTQAERSFVLTQEPAPNAFHAPVLGGFPKDGRMGLLAQLWSSPDMSWLSGPDCNSTNPSGAPYSLPSQAEATYTISNLAIERGGVSNMIRFAYHSTLGLEG